MDNGQREKSNVDKWELLKLVKWIPPRDAELSTQTKGVFSYVIIHGISVKDNTGYQ